MKRTFGTWNCLITDKANFWNMELSHYRWSELRNIEVSHYRWSALRNMELSHYRWSELRNMELSHYRWSALRNMELSHYSWSGTSEHGTVSLQMKRHFGAWKCLITVEAALRRMELSHYRWSGTSEHGTVSLQMKISDKHFNTQISNSYCPACLQPRLWLQTYRPSWDKLFCRPSVVSWGAFLYQAESGLTLG
jgi:hypothetical protein